MCTLPPYEWNSRVLLINRSETNRYEDRTARWMSCPNVIAQKERLKKDERFIIPDLAAGDHSGRFIQWDRNNFQKLVVVGMGLGKRQILSNEIPHPLLGI